MRESAFVRKHVKDPKSEKAKEESLLTAPFQKRIAKVRVKTKVNLKRDRIIDTKKSAFIIVNNET